MPDIASGAAGAGIVGSLGQGISSLFGGGDNSQSDAVLQAAQLQYQAQQDALNFQKEQLGQARGYMQPYYKAGTNALNLYSGLLNIPGYEKQDPTATLRATPGYDWNMSQGVNALDRGAAARGGLYSGAAGQGLTKYGQGLADNTYNNYLNRLQGMAGSGQNAAALQGGYGMQAAPQVGNYLTQGAQAQGMGLIGSQQAQQSAYNTQQQGIYGGLGSALGFANSMPSSGQNWLSNLFGGSGGSGYNSGYSATDIYDAMGY